MEDGGNPVGTRTGREAVPWAASPTRGARVRRLPIARGLPCDGCALEEARRYTRRLARTHYENFLVATWLLPRHLQQPFFDLYSYCRWADDLGDEVAEPEVALDLLDWWEDELGQAQRGRPRHPVFVALAATIAQFDLPLPPFHDLLRAFRQDQTKHRYANWEEVVEYSRYSANPVGRLVLSLCGYRDPERQRLSDDTCTALQLANFWQDVARDWRRDRLYIPLDRLAAHGLDEEAIAEGRFDDRYRSLMRELVGRTRDLFLRGSALAGLVSPGLRIDIALFTRSGLAVLDAIAAADYNTLAIRPVVPRSKQMGLLARALVSRWLGRRPASGSGSERAA